MRPSPLLCLLALLLIGCSADPATGGENTTTSDDPVAPEIRPEFQPIDMGRSSVRFETARGAGTFTEMIGTLEYMEGVLVGVAGTINAPSVVAEDASFGNALKGEEYLAVQRNPVIRWQSTSIINDMMEGELTFLGRTKKLQIPITVTAEGIEGQIDIDTGAFGMVSPMDATVTFRLVAQN